MDTQIHNSLSITDCWTIETRHLLSKFTILNLFHLLKKNFFTFLFESVFVHDQPNARWQTIPQPGPIVHKTFLALTFNYWDNLRHKNVSSPVCMYTINCCK